jgi:hypothetical protein
MAAVKGSHGRELASGYMEQGTRAESVVLNADHVENGRSPQANPLDPSDAVTRLA